METTREQLGFLLPRAGGRGRPTFDAYHYCLFLMMPLGPTAQRAPSSVPQRATAPASPLEPAGNVSVRTPTGPVQLYSRSTTTPSAAAKKVAPVGSTQTSVRSSGDSGRPSAVQDMPPSEDTTTLSCAPLATMTLPMLVPRTSHSVPAGATPIGDHVRPPSVDRRRTP